MPLYEYECGKCRHRFERIQQFSDPLVRKCPSCKTGRVKKLPSAPSVRFKGSGWYVTDYGPKRPSDESSSGEKESKAKESKGKESKDSSGKESAAAKESTPAKTAKKESGKKN